MSKDAPIVPELIQGAHSVFGHCMAGSRVLDLNDHGDMTFFFELGDDGVQGFKVTGKNGSLLLLTPIHKLRTLQRVI